ncbi:MAG: hypothetical protein JRM74_04910 [Nitrososphaerota archaeon]|nr:hypothetical protein [Nitrososphaerota archaeon]
MARRLTEPPNFVEYSKKSHKGGPMNHAYYTPDQCGFCVHEAVVKSPACSVCVRYLKQVSIYACCDAFEERSGRGPPIVELSMFDGAIIPKPRAELPLRNYPGPYRPPGSTGPVPVGGNSDGRAPDGASRRDGEHWWDKDVPVPFKPLDWCPIHNWHYDESKGQTCVRCDADRKSGTRREPRNPMGDTGLDMYLSASKDE